MRYYDNLYIGGNLQINQVNNAVGNELTALFYNDNKEVIKRTLGDIVTLSSRDFIQEINLSFPSIFNYTSGPINHDNNTISVSLITQEKGTVFAAHPSFNSQPSFIKLNRQHLDEADVIFTSHIVNTITQDDITRWNIASDLDNPQYLKLSGGTMDGTVTLSASTTSAPSLNIPTGTAPTSPVSGDMWFSGSALMMRIGTSSRTIAHTSSWSEISELAILGGTESTARFISARRLKYAFDNITADTSNRFATPRLINGIAFDGSSDITITATPNAHVHNISDITSLTDTLNNKQPLHINLTKVSGVNTTSVGFIKKDASNNWSVVDQIYSAGNGLTLNGTIFSLPVTNDGTGDFVTNVTQNTNGITITKGNITSLITGAGSSILTNNLTTNKFIISDSNGKVSASTIGVDDITTTKITDWNTAYTNNHTHSNKTQLDSINQSLSTASNVTFKSLSIYNSGFYQGWPTNTVSSPDNYHTNNLLQLTANNNALFIFSNGTTNTRRFAIQSGHNSSSYANINGILELNPYGGDVTVGTNLNIGNILTANTIKLSNGADTHILLAGGGTKLVSDLATSNHTHTEYLKTVSLNGTTLTISSQGVNIPIFSSIIEGLVPKRVGSTTTKFLREDGTWITPSDTTYSAGNGLTLSGTAFSLPITVSGSGNTLKTITQTANGITAEYTNMMPLGANILVGVDTTTLTESGVYFGYNWVNGASTGISTLTVIKYTPDWIVQEMNVPNTKTTKYVRSRYNGTTWGSWTKVLTTDDNETINNTNRASLITSTSATGVSNVATTNTNTYLNIVQNGASPTTSSSTQITGSGSVTVTSDTTGKVTITGVDTTYNKITNNESIDGSHANPSLISGDVIDYISQNKAFKHLSYSATESDGNKIIYKSAVFAGVVSNPSSNMVGFLRIRRPKPTSLVSSYVLELDIKYYIYRDSSTTIYGRVKLTFQISNGNLITTAATLRGTYYVGYSNPVTAASVGIIGDELVIQLGAATTTWYRNAYVVIDNVTLYGDGMNDADYESGWSMDSPTATTMTGLSTITMTSDNTTYSPITDAEYATVLSETATSTSSRLITPVRLLNFAQTMEFGQAKKLVTPRLINGIAFDGTSDITITANANPHTHTFAELTSKPTTLSGYGITDAMSTSHAANGITSALITNWNTAFTNNHTHSNKTQLDSINQSLSTTNDVQFKSLFVSDGILKGENGLTNHAIYIGKSGRDYMDFYEYGGIFNFYKSVSGTNTLLAKIDSNGVTANSFNGNASTATKLQTARSLSISGGAIVGSSVNFDGSSNVAIPVTGVNEAYLQWGGKNHSGSYSPIDGAMINDLGANRLAFMDTSGIEIEYSLDGGLTWIDYEASFTIKTNLFNGNSASIQIGKGLHQASDNWVDYQVRVTINVKLAKVYSILNKFMFYVSTNGSGGSWVTIQARTSDNLTNNVDTWLMVSEKASISGWSGYNIVNTNGITYGNGSGQYQNIRFTFGQNSISNANYKGLTISKIMGFGGVGWTTPSTMASNGRMYTYDAYKNITFPTKITATEIIKSDSSDNYVLLGGGGHKTLSSLITENDGRYLKLTGGEMTGAIVYGMTNTNAITRSFTYNSGGWDLRMTQLNIDGVLDSFGHYGKNNTINYGYLGNGRYSERNALRWTTDGTKVGIGMTGITAPTKQLYVNGDTQIDGQLMVNGDTNIISSTVNTMSSIPSLTATTGHSLMVGNSSNKYGTIFGTLSTGVGYIQQSRIDGTAKTYDLNIQPNGGKLIVGSGGTDIGGNVQLTTSNSAIVAYDGNNRIRFGSTGFVLSAPTQPIYFRTNGDSSQTNQIVFDTDGSVLAEIFKKRNGTNQQILLADGSVKLISDFSTNTNISSKFFSIDIPMALALDYVEWVIPFMEYTEITSSSNRYAHLEFSLKRSNGLGVQNTIIKVSFHKVHNGGLASGLADFLGSGTYLKIGKFTYNSKKYVGIWCTADSNYDIVNVRGVSSDKSILELIQYRKKPNGSNVEEIYNEEIKNSVQEFDFTSTANNNNLRKLFGDTTFPNLTNGNLIGTNSSNGKLESYSVGNGLNYDQTNKTISVARTTSGTGNAVTDVIQTVGGFEVVKGSNFSLSTHTHNNLIGESGTTYTDVNNIVGTTRELRWIGNIQRNTTNLFSNTNNANGILHLGTHNSDFWHQLGFNSYGDMYHRYLNGTWYKVLTTKQLTSENITELLTNTHTHSNKANLDTINQDLSTSASPTFAYATISASQFDVIRLHRTSNLGANIKFSNTNGTIGKLSFDNDGQFIIGNGTSTDGTPNMLSIKSTGVATFYNSVTATSFIKSGGLSTEFLKADGSVDTNTYLTTSQFLSGENYFGNAKYESAWYGVSLNSYSATDETKKNVAWVEIKMNAIGQHRQFGIKISTVSGNGTYGLMEHYISGTISNGNNYTETTSNTYEYGNISDRIVFGKGVLGDETTLRIPIITHTSSPSFRVKVEIYAYIPSLSVYSLIGITTERNVDYSTGYSNLGTSLKQLRINNGGATTDKKFNVTGYINADVFQKNGGTSAQFLKADGSVDSNTYSISTHNHDSVYTKKANTGGSNSVLVSDTRSVTITPTTDLKFGVSFDFKTISTLSLTSTKSLATYSAVMTFAPYNDDTGNNNIAYQLAHSKGQLYFRNYNVTYQSWNRILIESDLTTINDNNRASLITSTSTTGVSNVATTNTNTYLNIVQNGTSPTASSSTQLTGSGSVTVASDTSGKVTITGTDTTYSDGTLAMLYSGTDTTSRVWKAKDIQDYLKEKLCINRVIVKQIAFSEPMRTYGIYRINLDIPTTNSRHITIDFSSFYNAVNANGLIRIEGGLGYNTNSIWHNGLKCTVNNGLTKNIFYVDPIVKLDTETKIPYIEIHKKTTENTLLYATITIYNQNDLTSDYIITSSITETEVKSSSETNYVDFDSDAVGKKITGTSFIKSGGTSAQFLKADGSVDTNDYSLSTHNHNSYYLRLRGAYSTDPTAFGCGVFRLQTTTFGTHSTMLSIMNGVDSDAYGFQILNKTTSDVALFFRTIGSASEGFSETYRLWSNYDFDSTKITQWNSAYSKRISTVVITGTTTKTITLTHGDGTTTTGTWTDNNSEYLAGNGLTLSGTSFSLPITTNGLGDVVGDVTQTTNGLTITKVNSVELEGDEFILTASHFSTDTVILLPTRTIYKKSVMVFVNGVKIPRSKIQLTSDNRILINNTALITPLIIGDELEIEYLTK